MGFLAHLPELCDITFLVGEDKEPVCAVRAVLGLHTFSLSVLRHNFYFHENFINFFLPLLSLTSNHILGEFLFHKKTLSKFTFKCPDFALKSAREESLCLQQPEVPSF